MVVDSPPGISSPYQCLFFKIKDSNYTFKNWTYPNDTVFSNKQKDTIMLTKNDILTANFEQETNILDTNVIPSGVGIIDFLAC